MMIYTNKIHKMIQMLIERLKDIDLGKKNPLRKVPHTTSSTCLNDSWTRKISFWNEESHYGIYLMVEAILTKRTPPRSILKHNLLGYLKIVWIKP